MMEREIKDNEKQIADFDLNSEVHFIFQSDREKKTAAFKRRMNFPQTLYFDDV